MATRKDGNAVTKAETLPASIDAERQLLSGLLFEPAETENAKKVVESRDFFDDQHRAIYQTIVEEYTTNGTFDAGIIVRRLRDKKLRSLPPDEVAIFIGDLSEVVSTAAHVAIYAHEVRGKAKARRLVEISEHLSAGARNGHATDRIIADLLADVEDLQRDADIATAGPTFKRITSAELAHGNYSLDYAIEGAMVLGQPLIIAGHQKTLKTSLIIDAAIALATGGYWLGKFRVPDPKRVLVMSGESGLATLQETAIRICQKANQQLEHLTNLLWSDSLPQFGHILHLQEIERLLSELEIEILFIDPAYLCIPADDSGNLMKQGELLRGMSELCQRLGVTLCIAHHCKKNTGRDVGDMPELADIAWAGFGEFARQWWLVSRRERYEAGSGDHKLWLSLGGSAGHGSAWALDIAEGVRTEFEPRKWDVTLSPAAEVRSDARERHAEAQEERAREKAERQAADECKKVVNAMARLKVPATTTDISAAARLAGNRTKAALIDLCEQGHATETTIKKSNGQEYTAYQLPTDTFTQTHPDSTQIVGVSLAASTHSQIPPMQ